MSTREAVRTNCRICGAPLEVPATGRPPSFCSATCRKGAEYAIRRLDRRIAECEKQASEARVAAAWEETAGGRKTAERRLSVWQAEADLLRGQMQALLEP